MSLRGERPWLFEYNTYSDFFKIPSGYYYTYDITLIYTYGIYEYYYKIEK